MKTTPLKIGPFKFQYPIFLAPMVDVTDLPYRLLCRKAGAALAYTEMLYADAIIHENPRTKQLMLTKDESPKAIQITGTSVQQIKKALPFLKKFDIIDLNCGCPSKKITGNQAGSYLLNNPKKIASFVRALKTSGKVVTVKIRLGFKSNNALEVAKAIEQAGADAITVHARLASHKSSKPANWKELTKLKKHIKIPIIGNGDVTDGKSCKKMLEICDGAMIARAAIGDPLIFKRIKTYFQTGKDTPISYEESIKQLQEYLQLSKKYKTFSISRTKYIGSNFLKGFKGSAKIRNEFSKLKTQKQIEDFISDKSRTLL